MSNLINELRTFANAGFPIGDRAADRIVDLEAENAGLRIEFGDVRDSYDHYKQEVTRLSDHIQAIAEHHQTMKEIYGAKHMWLDEQHHTERRDFALSIFTKGETT